MRLPSKRVTVQSVELGLADRARYGALLCDAQETIGGMIENGSIFGNYAHALEVILRLRQLCCHGSLVPDDADMPHRAAAAAAPAAAPPTAEELAHLLGGTPSTHTTTITPPTLTRPF